MNPKLRIIDFAQVTVKGQITIPKQARQLFGIRDGDRLAFTVDEDGRLVLEKATFQLEDMRAMMAPLAAEASAQGLTEENMDELIHEVRRARARRLMADKRIMLDTNTLLSATLFPGGRTEAVLATAISRNDRILIGQYVYEEAIDVIRRKFHGKTGYFRAVMARLPAEWIDTPRDEIIKQYRGLTTDPYDLPIVASAIAGQADYLISGDKHLHTEGIKQIITVLTAADYLALPQ